MLFVSKFAPLVSLPKTKSKEKGCFGIIDLRDVLLSLGVEQGQEF